MDEGDVDGSVVEMIGNQRGLPSEVVANGWGVGGGVLAL